MTTTTTRQGGSMIHPNCSNVAALVALLFVFLPLAITGLTPRAIIRHELRRTATAVVGGAAVTAGVGYTLWQRQRQQQQSQPNAPNSNLFIPAADSLAGQVIMITGGTTGLGLETAKRLALGGPQHIILTARTHVKGQTAVHAIQDYVQAYYENNNDASSSRTIPLVSYRLLDLDSLTGIRLAVDSWTTDDLASFPQSIDVLINNAGVMALPRRELTEDGVERQVQSNHLGHFLLTALLAPRLAPQARIINVSSSAHQIATMAGGLDFDTLWQGGNSDSEYALNGWKSYGASKLCNIYFGQELYRQAQARGMEWDVASLHPGVVQTDLTRYIVGVDNWERVRALFGNSNDNNDNNNNNQWLQNSASQAMSTLFSIRTVPEGANTHVLLGANAAATPWRAAYYQDGKPKPLADVARDAAAARRLWTESEERAGLTNGFFAAWEEAQEDDQQSAVVPDVME